MKEKQKSGELAPQNIQITRGKMRREKWKENNRENGTETKGKMEQKIKAKT